MKLYYKLVGHEPIPCKPEEWAIHKVAQTKKNKVTVSTVFLGINHQFGEGIPVLFETMIFGGAFDEWQERCCTWDEAVKLHKKACRLLGIEEG